MISGRRQNGTERRAYLLNLCGCALPEMLRWTIVQDDFLASTQEWNKWPRISSEHYSQAHARRTRGPSSSRAWSSSRPSRTSGHTLCGQRFFQTCQTNVNWAPERVEPSRCIPSCDLYQWMPISKFESQDAVCSVVPVDNELGSTYKRGELRK